MKKSHIIGLEFATFFAFGVVVGFSLFKVRESTEYDANVVSILAVAVCLFAVVIGLLERERRKK